MSEPKKSGVLPFFSISGGPDGSSVITEYPTAALSDRPFVWYEPVFHHPGDPMDKATRRAQAAFGFYFDANSNPISAEEFLRQWQEENRREEEAAP